MSDDLDELLALADEDNSDSFVTCKEDITVNRTVSSVNDTFFSTATHVAEEQSFSDDDEERSTPVFKDLSDSPEERRLTLTEQETKDLCNAVRSPAIPLNLEIEAKEDIRDQLKLESDDSDAEELYEKRDLNASGKSIQKLLEKSNSIEKNIFTTKGEPVAKPQPPAPLGIQKFLTEKSIDAFDKFFGLKIKNPRVSSLTFDALVEGVSKVKLTTLRQGMELNDAWVTMGVIVEKGEIKKSAKNGNEYLIWKLHDLKNCQDKPVKVLLFGECCKEHWKLQPGSTVSLVSAQLADQSGSGFKDPLITLKVSKKSQVIDLGFCATFGHCKGTCQSGQKCSNFVNTESSEFCVYHVMSEARKLSSKRGVFNNVSAVAAKRRSTMPAQPPGLMVNRPLCKSTMIAGKVAMNDTGTIKTTAGTALKASELKTTSKEQEKAQLKQIMSDRAFLFGAKNLERHEANKNQPIEKKEVAQKHASMSNFIHDREETQKQEAISRGPTIGFGLKGSNEINLGCTRAKDAEAAAARARALAMWKKKREEAGASKDGSTAGKGVKRSSEPDADCGTPAKQRRQLGSITNKEELEKLLKKKSLHQNEVDKEELGAQERYFTGMEHKEKVESFTTGCMVMKNVKVITCKKCNYTAQKQSEYCMQQGHAIQKHTAEKRFFKCMGCKKRTTTFGLVPTKPCEHCECTDWERVAMRDERRVTLENEKLELRGEERKNVNT